MRQALNRLGSWFRAIALQQGCGSQSHVVQHLVQLIAVVKEGGFRQRCSWAQVPGQKNPIFTRLAYREF